MNIINWWFADELCQDWIKNWKSKNHKHAHILQELQPKIGEELCKLWDTDQAGGTGQTPRLTNSTNRRGKPSVPTQTDHHPTTGQWQGAQYTAMQQVYATHTPSMPILVPIPSAHSRHIIAAPYFRPSQWLSTHIPPSPSMLMQWHCSLSPVQRRLQGSPWQLFGYPI